MSRVELTSTPSPQDDWPHLANNAGLATALSRQLPPYFTAGSRGDNKFTAMSYAVLGATKRAASVDLYVWTHGRTWSLTDGVCSSIDVFGNACRVRLVGTGGIWLITAVDTPPGGMLDDPPNLFPPWADERGSRTDGGDFLFYDCTRLAEEWLDAGAPADRLVEQLPATFIDPHRHEPPVESLRMLSPDLAQLTITPLGEMNESLAEAGSSDSWSSADQRFRLRHAAGSGGWLLEDANSRQAYLLAGPSPGQFTVEGPEPDWSGHSLVFDWWTDPAMGDSHSAIHYEIDCDAMQAVRAVPVGPLAANAPVR